MPRRLLHRVRLIQNVLAGEFAVRIARPRCPSRDAVAVAEPVRGRPAQQRVDLLLRPDVERAFALFVGMFAGSITLSASSAE